MADVTHLPGVFEQIGLVAGLRWRLLRNSMRKKNARLDLMGLIFVGLLGGILVVGVSFAFYSGAYTFLSTGRPAWLSLLFWGVFVFWQVFPIFVAGFGANFEFRTLLRFPLSLTAFYIVGLAYGLADFSSAASLCWLLSLAAGAVSAKPQVFPAMLLIVALFLVLNVTLERLIGSWLERLLSRRLTREIFLGLFVLSMVSLNLINPIVARYGATLRPIVLRLMPYFSWLPPSLAGRALAGAVDSQPSAFLLGSTGLLLYAVFLSVFLWRRFAAQFRGEELSETAAPARAAARPALAAADDSDHLSALSPQVAAVVRKEFRYLTRNGFAFLTLLLPPILVLFFTAQFAGTHTTHSGRSFSFPPDMFFPAMTAYLILILMAPAYNSFAYEGRGIQTYFMAPVRFREIFLGKNLMLVSVLMVEIALSLAMLAWRVGLPSLPIFVATLVGIVFAIATQLTIANWSSLNFPRKLEFGQMRGQRQSGMAALTTFATQLLLGSISGVILFTGRWTGNPWVPTETFALLAAAAVAGYFSSLEHFSHLAEAKKERLIEALCR
jgi:hypothetical protein